MKRKIRIMFGDAMNINMPSHSWQATAQLQEGLLTTPMAGRMVSHLS